jgi:hypothetical protein
MTVRGNAPAGTDAGPVTAVVRVDHGDPTVIVTDSVELTLRRILDGPGQRHGPAALTGTWGDQADPVLLAEVRDRRPG